MGSGAVSTAGAAPIYVVDRTDVVRIFVDIPEQDSNYVQIGTRASVIPAAVLPIRKRRRLQLIAGCVWEPGWMTLIGDECLPRQNSEGVAIY